MIVDLLRNDLGKIAETGTVKVTALAQLQSFPGVHHLVSHIQAVCRANISPLQAFKACFPGGSITGAPKLRAMEIISELEPHNRGIYTGSLGYIDYRGQMDLNIAIRTIIYKYPSYFIPVGGGIVADSVPLDEYEETLHKGKALIHALLSQKGFSSWEINCLNRSFN